MGHYHGSLYLKDECPWSHQVIIFTDQIYHVLINVHLLIDQDYVINQKYLIGHESLIWLWNLLAFSLMTPSGSKIDF